MLEERYLAFHLRISCFGAEDAKRDRKSLAGTSPVIGCLQCCCVFVSCVACSVVVASFAECSKPGASVNVGRLTF